MPKDPANRLRPPAADRLADSEECFDLSALAEKLRKEDYPTKRGHHQMTIFKKEQVTMVLFIFEEGAELKEHAANGTVTIQCIEGSLTVGSEESDYQLKKGHLVALAPKISHNVIADEPSVMLLTVCRKN